ncbi:MULTISPECIES: glutamate--cysteine ligase [unclassified Streptomyces]|uniref:glutamate--cysteine ligase 2 n=1 Tax=unclassified Streptomyces TaxID=2593676 RepID=UPI000DBA9F5C|nr:MULTISPECIES: glutamate--cysteine ligase [unclassified Streptomyces]MYT73579.1 YbdK family carboxylate-amine ligase [Streptomyces sp. SID8367]RAJ85116.1 carboxylate-amine ligase [Streptomyces sp. PsTaAH-137]
MRSVGVEEELLLVDRDSGEPRAMSSAVMAVAAREDDADFEAELHREQLEFNTRPHHSMSNLAEEIVRWRATAADHAEKLGGAAVALATSPLPVSPTVGTGKRHQWLAREFGLTTQEQLTCGCHVHVGVESDEEGVAVLNRLRPWMSVLVALSANSPFWQGEDSGYSSYRSRVWGRWPTAGPVELFDDAAAYHREVQDMVATGVVRDRGMVYFDARLSAAHPTVEVRVADVCLEPFTTVLLAMLVRGLVETAARDWRAGEPAAPHPVSLLRLASWRAGRSGLDGELVSPLSMRPVPARTAVESLVEYVRPALEDAGDYEEARTLLSRLLRDGSGARVQREVHRRTGELREVVEECVRRTHSGM